MFNSLKVNTDWSKKVKRPRIEDPNRKANYQLTYSTRNCQAVNKALKIQSS